MANLWLIQEMEGDKVLSHMRQNFVAARPHAEPLMPVAEMQSRVIQFRGEVRESHNNWGVV
jgi:hypothetical protein